MRMTIVFRASIAALLMTLAPASVAQQTPAAAQAPEAAPPHQSLTIASTVMGEDRVINIYTPPGYAEAAERRFPVLYMLDGGLNEDFPHIATTVDALIRDGSIPPTILVGIANTQRRRDMTPNSSTRRDAAIAPLDDGAGKFRQFIRTELLPQIDQQYRTTAQRSVIGESAAGLFVVDTLMRDPTLFANYIAFDPSLWWDSRAIIRRTSPAQLAALPRKPLRLWLAGSGTDGIASMMDAFKAQLERHAPPTLQWSYLARPDTTHATIFRATKEQALREVLGTAAASTN